jgi:hypothetical protein
MKFILGYSWVDFDFAGSSIILSPGRYWVALGFTDSAIVNWFFTYGKPVGPQDGTRYEAPRSKLRGIKAELRRSQSEIVAR